jgi:hypothetical protein
VSHSEIEPWDRRDDETSRAYHAFCLYRDMGPQGRSLRAVTEELYGDEGENMGSVSSHVERWSSRFDWVARSTAWDDYMAERMREELEQRRIEDKIERIASLDALHEVINDALGDLDASDLSPGMLEKLLKLVVQEKRKEFDDEPTQRVEGELDQVTTFELPDNGRGSDHE